VRVRSSLRAPGTAPLVGIAMKAGYREAFETTNEFGLGFEEGQLSNGSMGKCRYVVYGATYKG